MTERALPILLTLGLVLAGCGVPREQYIARTIELRQLEAAHEAQGRRVEAMEAELIELLAAMDELEARRDLLVRQVGELEAKLALSELERTELLALNAELHSRQQELARLSEQISTVWYRSALERARRATRAGSEVPSRPAGAVGTGQP